MFSKPKKHGKHDPLRMQIMVLREMREEEDENEREPDDDEDDEKPKKRRKRGRDKLQQKETH